MFRREQILHEVVRADAAEVNVAEDPLSVQACGGYLEHDAVE